MPSTPIPIFWHCPNGHILGFVETNHNREHLIVFRHACAAPPPDTALPIASVAIGDAVYYCEICGARRKWTYQPARSFGTGPS